VYRGKSIAVVVPAFNEEVLISETLEGIPDFVDRIYVCNDHSTDSTLQIITNLAEKDSRIFIIDHQVNTGVGGAIVDGHLKGLEDGMDIMAVMAGDNQMDPNELFKLLDPIVDDKTDFSKGNRLFWRDALTGMGRWRIFGNSILTLLNKISSGYWHISDPQNGYTAINREALMRIPLNNLNKGYLFENDILVKLNAFDLRAIDIPIPARYGKERSKIKYGKFIFEGLWVLFFDFLYRMKVKYVVRNFHPLVFFYSFGFMSSAAGLFAALWSLYMKVFEEQRIFERITLSLLIFLAGIQFIFFGMYFDMAENKRIQGK
jgi:glycosyltransferase involved in cell wall biosynthesis